ncbi:HAMP domain-containing histidine kinase [Pendulispora brunnea]|uniref:histidine kinase n=1 Tax=Pendulispora brunnea TaxID=2905690 RepID=A0ABZ2JYL9_9BACT
MRRLRLVQRIYLVGMAQFAVVAIVAVVVFLVMRSSRIAMFRDSALNFVVATLEAEARDRASLQPIVDRAADELHWSVTIYDANGAPIAFSQSQPLAEPQPSAVRRRRLDLRGELPMQMVVSFPDLPPSPGVALFGIFVLAVVGISSWLTARSLAVPLERLASTARAFGAGRLSARTHLLRTDELGDVARAFDDMADRVTKAIQAKRELLANISHELRTPLQRIRIALDLAAEGDATTAHDSLRDIAEDLADLEVLVGDVLTATRLALREGAGSASALPPISFESVRLSGLLERSVSRFRSAHSERELDASISTPMPTILADPRLLRRVFDNLLENAHKYTDDGHRPIHLSCASIPDGVVVEVRDYGIGIAAADLERIFEPFFRADRSRTRATGGLGLGLTLARHIVEAHGGTLSLTSELGQGTTARVELPLNAGRASLR